MYRKIQISSRAQTPLGAEKEFYGGKQSTLSRTSSGKLSWTIDIYEIFVCLMPNIC
jgi:hypothetical protein